MATLISAASGNLTDSTTFALADAASLNAVRSNITGNAYIAPVTCAAFTVGSVTVDGVILWIKNQVTSPSGTLTVELLKSGVVQASSVVNKADFSPYNSNASTLYTTPVFFKFNNTVAGDNTANWTLRLTGSTGSTNVYVAIFNATTSNFTRLLRTTTLQAPAAGDNLYIVGEQTGPGTVNNITVTMNSTAATAYGSGVLNSATVAGGGMYIGKNGSLVWPTTANINTILRLNGDLTLWDGGTFQMGTVAAPIPSTSTAILEFQQTSVSGDFGYINYEGGTTTIVGSPRTPNKPVVYAKLNTGGLVQGNTTSGSAVISGVTDFTKVAVGLSVSGSGIPVSPIPTVTTINTGAGTFTISANTTATASLVPLRIFVAAGAKTLPVDTDTGWLSGDVVALASTSTTASEGEVGALTANATATSLVTQGWTGASNALPVSYAGTLGTLYNHDAGSHVPAEVALLTRNVKIRSTSTTLMSYMVIGNPNAPMSFTALWAEFYWMGANAGAKSGLCLNNTLGGNPVLVQYCSFHDTLQTAITCNSLNNVQIGNWNVLNNTFWNCAASAGVTLQVNASYDSSWSVSNNISLRNLFGSTFTLGDVGGTVSNNMISGSAAGGINCTESAGIINNISNNIIHSCTSTGISMGTNGGTLLNNISSRNDTGMILSTALDSIIDGGLAIGNGTVSINMPTGVNGIVRNTVLTGDVLFPTASALGTYTVGHSSNVLVDNCDLGNGVFPYVNTTLGDIYIKFLGASDKITCRNTKFNSPIPFAGQNFLSSNSFLSSQRHNGIPGSHRTYLRYGLINLDSTIFNTASPSERLSPTTAQSFAGTISVGSNVVTLVQSFETIVVGQQIYHAAFALGTTIQSFDKVARTITLSNPSTSALSNTPIFLGGKLESGSKLIPVDSGQTVNVSVYVRTSTANDGNLYTGNPPRLIQKANPAIGVPSDVVLATFNGASGTWATMTGTTSASTDDGMIEVLVDCDGGAPRSTYLGWINIDDWSVS